MRKIFYGFMLSGLIMSCNNEKPASATEEKAEEKVAPMSISMPYTPSYSASFEMGNPAYATTIVQGSWKDWEDNKLENMKNWVADTIVAYHSDNTVIRGVDSLMARWIRNRAEYSSVIDTINAVIPVYSTDKNENWVLVWANETSTKANGTTEKVSLMETWRINKDGKADLLLQYDRRSRK